MSTFAAFKVPEIKNEPNVSNIGFGILWNCCIVDLYL